MIVIIDYGMGNLASVGNALNKIGFEAIISSDPHRVMQAAKVILPGVGAFEDAIKNLHDSGMDQAIYEVVRRQTPLLGICLGMQLMMGESEENGLHKGLDLVPGRVVRFDLGNEYKVPHMGWNQVWPREDSLLFRDIEPGSHFYFVHSYYTAPDEDGWAAATCDYGSNFVCSLEQGNIFATQFHPEKSGETGLRLLANFAGL